MDNLQQPAEENLRWTSAAVLVALAARKMSAGQQFTQDDLRAWVPQLAEGKRTKHALCTLTQNGLITSKLHHQPGTPDVIATYTLTTAGGEAIKAAADGQRLTSGPRGPHSKDRAVPRTTFAARLWALLRARQMLDTETAAATLVDAGGDVATAAKTAQRYLARWASTGALAVSAQRMANGCKRYVLVKDPGPIPPAWTEKARQRAESRTLKGAAL